MPVRHNTFTPEALALIVRSGDGILRRTRTTGGWGASGETAAGSPQGQTSGSERIN